jgi:hypothetical protein
VDGGLEYPGETRKSIGKCTRNWNIQGMLGNQLESGRGTGISRGSLEINWKVYGKLEYTMESRRSTGTWTGNLNIQGKLGNQLESGRGTGISGGS